MLPERTELLRYKSLDADFGAMLRMLDIQQVSPLLCKNNTLDKQSDYY
jgi:hypothetical protein